MRKSITLLITVVLIIALASLMHVALTMTQQEQQQIEEKRDLIQAEEIRKDITKILSLQSKDLNKTEGLSFLMNIPIMFHNDTIMFNVTFQSAARGINLNQLFIQKRVHDKNVTIINEALYSLVYRLLRSYNVREGSVFLALLLDSLDADKQERYPGSEIALYDIRFRDGKIENMAKLNRIKKAYLLLTGDKNINTIPWDEVITFHNQSIDINYVSSVLLSLLIPRWEGEVRNQIVQQQGNLKSWSDLSLTKKEQEELRKLHIVFYAPLVEVTIRVNDISMRYIYDISHKKVLDIAYFQ